MSTTPQSLQAHDTDVHRNHTPSSSYQIRLGSCIEACTACAQACTTCIDDRLSDNMDYQLRGCISADLDCADICSTTARVLSRQAGFDASLTRALLLVCIHSCRTGQVRHYTHINVRDRCRSCSDACRTAEEACRELLYSLG